MVEAVVWQSIVIAAMLAIGFGVAAFRLATIPRPNYAILVKLYPKSVLLLLLRILTLLLFVAVFVVSLNRSNFHDMVYYTYWNFTIQTIYVLAAIIHQLATWSQPRPVHANQVLNVLWDVAFPSCILVVGVYWGVLYTPAKVIPWTTYVVHGGNLGLLFLEFAFNEYLIQRNNLKFVVMWPALYGAVTWITMATGLNSVWPYDLLDVSKPLAPLKWFGIVAGHVVAFGVALLLSSAKLRLVPAPPEDNKNGNPIVAKTLIDFV
ncbi:unnamed protein product [Aphanomyces euteiches]|uniref:FAR-17a/AIG1-like protein n=1 Tax=Aphanomyces euteiches TaxID=100861 RepID=A0A6G0WW88_9STRA|nr:hypothetical protein Ae201684_011088 [Aphanomyces euteiches]KAH9058630.1 hypothetical protein Ae201684P_005972 [Aphanomyces euteiches]KAH9136152.1 hypothetical protein AeRB84_018620 [Aphanomyces euteiches]